MINKIIKPIHRIAMFIEEMKHLSISQWDIEQKNDCYESRQK
jgi:hypothetical protein